MATGPNATNKKWPVKRTVIISILVLLTLSGIYLYRNFNQLLSDALLKSFNSSVISDVYELKFENLQVNLYNGSIRVFNVSVLPREKPLKDYPYINSSFSLKTENLLLESVEIRTLLKENRLILSNILISKPEIEFLLNGTRHVMLPFKDKAATTEKKDSSKRPIESFGLKEFQLKEATFHSINNDKQREFRIYNLNISVHDLLVSQALGEYKTSFSEVALAIGEFGGELKKGPIKQLRFENFDIGIDSLDFRLTLDTLIYQFHDFHARLNALDIQTADSIFHVAMKSFDLSYEKKSIKLEGVSFKPNVSHAVLQKDFKYQHTEFSGSVGSIALNAVNFDSVIYANKLFIDEIELFDTKASIFKDKTKPIDSTRFPLYLAQSISGIKLPMLIKKIKASNVELENTEKKPDGSEAKVKINKAKVEVHNLTNLAPKEKLEIYADANINGKVRFTASLAFSYSQPQFSFKGTLAKFDLPDLNELIQAYTPAKITQGTSDEISFEGVAEKTSASGTMKFLYHDLKIDLELQDQARWKSSVIAFAANTALHSNNPVSTGVPPREVKFQIERDMNKGFVNVLIKSVLNGLKETMIMNKENRKSYKEEKKKAKEENKNR
jgi:hypothetical protein